jgi:hypothetical protein
MEQVEDAVEKGATVVIGGGVPSVPAPSASRRSSPT